MVTMLFSTVRLDKGVQVPPRWLLITLLIVAWNLFTPMSMQAETTATVISQDITVNTTWTKAASPYNVTQFIRVRPGVTLTVEPGVEVAFDQHASLRVEGVLTAQGTANEPILFTGSTKQPGAWNGITISNVAAQPAQAILDHVIVEYAIYVGMEGAGNVEINYANADIRNSIFRLGGGNGLVISSSATATIADSSFTNNTLQALRINYGAQSTLALSNLSASGNGTLNAVVYASGNVAGALVLNKMGLPYVFKGGFDVEKTGHLTINPGVQVQVDTGFYVDGILTAVGTADEPILITGIKQQPGGWWGLNISGDFTQLATATLDHVIIEYGGGDGGAYEANLNVSAANVTVTNTTLRHSNGHGILNDGGSPDQPFVVTIADSTIADNVGDAVTCMDESCNMTLTNLTVTGNGRNGYVQRTAVSGDTLWRNMGLPYFVEGQGGVADGGTLTIEPGVEIRMEQDAIFYVNGALYANGTAAQPITFTGTQAQPGWWQRIQVDNDGVAELKYCDISYGGKTVNDLIVGQVQLASSAVVMSECRIHHSGSAGISVSGGAQPILLYNRIEENVHGLAANFSLTQVDARNNWWGNASGPTHEENPGGTGQSIIGNVLYKPWLTSPDEHNAAGGLDVNVIGPGRFSPGDSIQYSAVYQNLTDKPVENAVIRLALPANANLESMTPGGIVWPQRNHVFWKVGTLTPGTVGAFFVKVRYDWGLPDGLKSTVVAQLGGTNLDSSRFTVQPYLDYVPRILTNSVDLSVEQVQTARNAHADLEKLYQQAVGAGFFYAGGEQHTYSTGEQETLVTLLRFQPQFASFRLSTVGDKTVGILADGISYTVYRGTGALRYSMQNNAWSPIDPTAAAVTAASTSATNALDWGDCMENCIADKLPGYVIKKYIKSLSDASKAISCVSAANDPDSTDSVLGCAKYLKKIAPGASEAIDLGQCNSDCQDCEDSGGECTNPHCHCCTEDSVRCDANDSLYGIFGVEVIKRRKCNIEEGEEFGRYYAEVVERTCALCEKCVDNGDSMACVAKNATFLQATQAFASALSDQHVSAELQSLSSQDLECDDCVLAKDPNEIYGPQGDLLPGQVLSYTIAYENIGAGNAIGVFIVNKLDPAFDMNTLVIQGDAQVSKNARTIIWNIGDLTPKGETGSEGRVSYTVKLRSDLPSGTILSNSAVVHFPSVPEETPTNVIVNTIQPLIAEPQTLDVVIGQPLAITLKGQDAIGLPLTYTILEGPDFGTLSGTAPALTYTPAEQSIGGDRIVFTVSNGTSTSAPASITLRIAPSPNDKTAPTIRWTAPAQGETVMLVEAAAYQGDQFAYFYPVIQVQFSEAMQAASVTNTTIVVTDAAGQIVPADVTYDGSAQQAVILMRQQPQTGVPYTVTITPGVTDQIGNGFATPYAWSFQVAGETQATIYLPLVNR